MSVNNAALVTNLSYGVPQPPYYDGSSVDFRSRPVEAASYYAGHGSIQTITITVTDFVGRIKLRGSLNSTYQDAHYFDTDEFVSTDVPSTTTVSYTITGSFVWMDAQIRDFTQGTINSVTIAY